MVDRRDTSGDNPDIFEGLRGAAHLADLAARVVRGTDPQLRNQVDLLGDMSVEQAVRGGQGVFEGEVSDPHLEIHDTEYGVDVLIDTAETPVIPRNIHIDVVENTLTLDDAESSWFTQIETQDAIEEVERGSVNNEVAQIQVIFESGGVGPSMDDDEEDDRSDETTEEDFSTQDDDDFEWDDEADDGAEGASQQQPPTVREFLEDNPWFEKKLEETVGPQGVQMALAQFGDMRASDVDLEQLFSFQEDQGDDGDDSSPVGDALSELDDQMDDDREWSSE